MRVLNEIWYYSKQNRITQLKPIAETDIVLVARGLAMVNHRVDLGLKQKYQQCLREEQYEIETVELCG